MRRALLLLLPSLAFAQTFDFEPGEPPWTRDPVFASQPVDAAIIKTGALARSPLGGDYWSGLHFPVGQHARHLVATAEAVLGDSATGILTSPDFRLDHRYLSLLVGGTHDPAYERVELQVRASGEWFTYFSATGGPEALRQETF